MTKARELADVIGNVTVNTSKLAGIEIGAKDDQTAAEIVAAYNSEAVVLMEDEAVTSYTINDADTQATNILQIDALTAAVVTVPPTSTGEFTIGRSVTLRQKGIGAVSILAGAGVTITSPEGMLIMRSQYSVATLVYEGADVWMLFGDLK